jgi:hypothetical protein
MLEGYTWWHGMYSNWSHMSSDNWATLILLILFGAWSAYWKIFGLWHAARDGKKWWVVALIVINTLGILEIIYIFAVRTRHGKKFSWLKPFD